MFIRKGEFQPMVCAQTAPARWWKRLFILGFFLQQQPNRSALSISGSLRYPVRPDCQAIYVPGAS